MKQINNGFKPCYYLTESGKIYNSKTDKYLKSDKNSYKLALVNGSSRTICIKELYKLVYNKTFCIDNIENLKGEQWKEIENTSGNYYISNLGRVKSCKSSKAYILNPYYSGGKYKRVDILYNGNIRKSMLIHRLVAAAFLEQPKSSNYHIHHKDFNCKNNKASNLEWLDISEHAKLHRQKQEQEKGDVK